MFKAAIPFPDIGEVLFRIPAIDIDLFGGFDIGPFELRWYALAYIAGLVCAWIYTKRLVSKTDLWADGPPATPLQIDDLLFWGALGVIIGGRLGYVLVYDPAYFLQNPQAIPAVWTGGMSFHGGFAGVVLAVFLYCRVKGLTFLPLMDAVACGVPIGLFFGRVANFINQELWGHVTNVPWAVIFPRAGPEPRHPSQLYEAALEGIVLFVVLRICSHRYLRLKQPGYVSGVFALIYGVSRIVVEFFRVPDAHIGYFAGGLTMGISLSVPMVLLGLFLIARAGRTAA